jgi:hypothetical protein
VDTATARLIHAETMDLGDEPMRWRGNLFPRLDALHEEHRFEAIGSESPVILYGALKKGGGGKPCATCGHSQDQERQFINQRSSIGIFGSVLLLDTWASLRGIPFQHARPMVIKEFACLRAQEPFVYGRPPSKAQMVAMVEKVSGVEIGCHHAADAYFAALTVYSSVAA